MNICRSDNVNMDGNIPPEYDDLEDPLGFGWAPNLNAESSGLQKVEVAFVHLHLYFHFFLNFKFLN